MLAVQAKGYTDAWLKRYAPQKKYDSNGLRYRAGGLCCQSRVLTRDRSRPFFLAGRSSTVTAGFSWGVLVTTPFSYPHSHCRLLCCCRAF